MSSRTQDLPYRVTLNRGDLGGTYEGANGGLPTYRATLLIPQQEGVYEVKINETDETAAVLDFAATGGHITLGKQPAIPMNDFLDYVPVKLK
jgi:hypothetical protein